MDVLKHVFGEVYPLAPFGEDGEEGTTASADEDDEDGTDPQVEMGVSAAARTTI